MIMVEIIFKSAYFKPGKTKTEIGNRQSGEESRNLQR